MAIIGENIAPKPDHVPADLVVDLDFFNLQGGGDDPQAAWRRTRPTGALAWTPHNGGHWIACSPEAVFRFYRDTDHFSATELSIPKMGTEFMAIPNQSDPPLHAEYRKNIMPMFTTDAVDAMSDKVRELCVSLIEELRPRGKCEFVTDFAFRFPLGIFMQMMGLPDADRMYLRGLVEKSTASPQLAVRQMAAAELTTYIDRQIEDRIANPREDALTRVTHFRFGDRPYTHDELRGTVRLLLIAGLDTVAGVLCFIARHLAMHPNDAAYVRARLDQKRPMQEIVQEFLRRYPIVSSSRVLIKDYAYEGVIMKKGDMLLMPSAYFNMDDARPEPEIVDFDRTNKKHITFGSGIHACAGALLAREELHIFLQEWLSRMPDVQLDPAHPPLLQTSQLNGARELHLQWAVPDTAD